MLPQALYILVTAPHLGKELEYSQHRAVEAAGWAAMGVAVETGDTEADGELKPMGKLIFVM